MQNGKNNAKLKKDPPNPLPDLGENEGEIISTWNLGKKYDRRNQDQPASPLPCPLEDNQVFAW
jgi:hypothetical protein